MNPAPTGSGASACAQTADPPKACGALPARARDDRNSRALEKLAIMHEKGRGTPVNPARALDLMRRAADLGNTNAMANLGAYYMKGLAMPGRNEREAARLFKQCADQRNSMCQFFYAQCLEAGLGVPKDVTTARQFYVAAAEAGVAPAIEWCRRNGVPFIPKQNP